VQKYSFRHQLYLGGAVEIVRRLSRHLSSWRNIPISLIETRESAQVPNECYRLFTTRSLLRMIFRLAELLMNADLLGHLAEYINVLAARLKSTKHPQDRSAYERHLAAAALIRESLRQSNFEQARQHIASEERNFGWSFLPGEEGNAAEAAFVRFKNLFESVDE
jgi:hypothetical protein